MTHQKIVPHEIEKLRNNAWIGDAVLELYARSLVLKTAGKRDVGLKARLTSNQFLNGFNQPTRVEAEIGVLYQEKGLDAAFDHIREKIEPLFLKQEARRQRSHRP